MKAFSKVETNLQNINIFHTDRGNEFKNKLIDETLEAFEIERSLSMKGCPYDNAVAEATYKIIKTEFVKNRVFSSLEGLKIGLVDNVNWFNNHRIHSSLGYLTPREFKENTLKKVVKKTVDYPILLLNMVYLMLPFQIDFVHIVKNAKQMMPKNLNTN